MELKDIIKQLRKEKGITQSELAEAIYVSRSTVAKWENGLGLPNQKSIKMLEEYFGIDATSLSTTEPEAVIVEKNRCIRWSVIGSITGWCVMVLLLIGMCILPFAIHNRNYGLTPEMAAGVFADNDYIDTGDYRIYYSVFEGNWENGSHWRSLSTFRPVEKHLWGYTVSSKDYTADVILYNNYLCGHLYSIKGLHGYYNIIKNTDVSPAEEILVTAKAVEVNGIEYELQHGFFFITPNPIEYFTIGDAFFNVA